MNLLCKFIIKNLFSLIKFSRFYIVFYKWLSPVWHTIYSFPIHNCLVGCFSYFGKIFFTYFCTF
nr:MAG TPA: hypothetical protein [Caudoviricetes sp.]